MTDVKKILLAIVAIAIMGANANAQSEKTDKKTTDVSNTEEHAHGFFADLDKDGVCDFYDTHHKGRHGVDSVDSNKDGVCDNYASHNAVGQKHGNCLGHRNGKGLGQKHGNGYGNLHKNQSTE